MKALPVSCRAATIAVLGTLCFGAQSWATSVDCSGTKRAKAAPFKEVIHPGDRPDHELILAIRTHAISSRDPDFDGSEQTVYALHDEYAHAGTQSGYFLYTLKSGEKIWARFDSVNSTTGGKDSWEVTYQGVFRFIGGTGKYESVHGGGHYRGKVRPDTGFDETFVCSMEY